MQLVIVTNALTTVRAADVHHARTSLRRTGVLLLYVRPAAAVSVVLANARQDVHHMHVR